MRGGAGRWALGRVRVRDEGEDIGEATRGRRLLCRVADGADAEEGILETEDRRRHAATARQGEVAGAIVTASGDVVAQSLAREARSGDGTLGMTEVQCWLLLDPVCDILTCSNTIFWAAVAVCEALELETQAVSLSRMKTGMQQVQSPASLSTICRCCSTCRRCFFLLPISHDNPFR